MKHFGEVPCPLFRPGDTVVGAALHSDCVTCRGRVMIGPPEQKGCAVTEEPRFTSRPMEGAEAILMYVQRRRHGL